MLYYVAYWIYLLPQLPYWVNLLGELTYVFTPLTLLYLFAVNGKPIKPIHYVHFIPFLIISLLFISEGYKFGSIVQSIYFLIYVYLIWNAVNSSSEKTIWIKQVALSYSVVVFGFLCYFFLVWNRLLTPQYDYWISATMSFFIYFIGYKAILNPELLSEKKIIPKYQKSLLSEGAAESISQRIVEHIESNKLYKKGEYKLVDLANEISIPSHSISQVLNIKMQMSFNELINSYRIREAKKLLQEKENASIISIAYSVGFNNKVSFNNTFKKHTGFTPSQYKNNEHEVNVSLN